MIRKGITEMLKKKAGGEITVFLSLTLTCICALMCGLLESVRVAGSGWYLQMSMNSSLDSLMSKYHRQIWEDYHLILLEFEDEEGLQKELEPYLSAYMDSDFSYNLQEQKLQVSPPLAITAQGGRYLEQEILDYMKLGIWNMENDLGKLDTMIKDMKEADSLGELAERFQMDTRQTIKLEQAIENIGTSLGKQEQYLEEGKKQLRRCDGDGFISRANKLLKELDKMPDLVRQYEKEADRLSENLNETDSLAAGEMENLKGETANLLFNELNSLRSYTEKEGERRKQIKSLEAQAAVNQGVVEDAIREAQETQEYIEELNDREDEDGDDEDGDDDDEPDEEELWEAVLETLNRFQVNRSFTGSGIKDKKTMNLLERISKLAGGDLLSLVIPEDREVSGASVHTSAFPSQISVTSDSGDIKDSAGLLDVAFINEYTLYHFTNFLSEEDKVLRYEQEYILNGADSDRQNLKDTVNHLLKLRGALNLLHLLKDSEKRGEAQALAATITGAAGIAPLSKVLSFFILTVWAFGESLEDVKALLKGGGVPFIKSKEDWKLSLSALLQMDSTGKLESNSSGTGEKGLDYQDYLRLFLLMQKREEKNYRIMDMIQKNISLSQNSFLIAKCAVRIEIECSARGKYAVLRKTSSKTY